MLASASLVVGLSGCSSLFSHLGSSTSSPPPSVGATTVSKEQATTPPNLLQPYGPKGSWRLVFSDKFTGSTLDSAKWSTCYFWGCTNNGNRELETYAASQVKVGGGALTLTAERTRNHGRPYVSGMLSSYGKFSFQYGYAQFVAKLPEGRGLWSAFWMLPTSGKWPPEIDALEDWGDQREVHMFIHPAGVPQQAESLVLPSFASTFHTYGVDWEPGSISWYVDGVLRARYVGSITNRMYLLADLAITAGRAPGSSERFPKSVVIRSIEVWQHPSKTH